MSRVEAKLSRKCTSAATSISDFTRSAGPKSFSGGAVRLPVAAALGGKVGAPLQETIKTHALSARQVSAAGDRAGRTGATSRMANLSLDECERIPDGAVVSEAAVGSKASTQGATAQKNTTARCSSDSLRPRAQGLGCAFDAISSFGCLCGFAPSDLASKTCTSARRRTSHFHGRYHLSRFTALIASQVLHCTATCLSRASNKLPTV